MTMAEAIQAGSDNNDAFDILEMAGDLIGVPVDRTRSFNNAAAMLIMNLAVKARQCEDPTA